MRALVSAVYGEHVSDEPSNELFRRCDNDLTAYWTCADVLSRTVVKMQIAERSECCPTGSYSGADLFLR
jgi:hypothetical protein